MENEKRLVAYRLANGDRCSYDITIVDLGRTIRSSTNVETAKLTLSLPDVPPGEYFLRISHGGIVEQQFPLIAE